MDSVEKFAREAAAFERWLLLGTDREAAAVSQCLIRLLDLYRAGIDLPREWSDELDDRAEIELVSDAEWRRAYEASQRLPLDYYSEVFDPTKTPSEVGIPRCASPVATTRAVLGARPCEPLPGPRSSSPVLKSVSWSTRLLPKLPYRPGTMTGSSDYSFLP